MKSEKLKDSSQWQSWHQRVKVFAQRRDIWDLCNPDADELHRPEALREPIAADYPDDGSQEDKRDWRDRLEVYKIKANRWDRQRKSLNEIDDLIVNSLDASLRDAVLKCETPYDRLVYLSKRFARSEAYTEEVRMQWRALSTQKPTGDVEKWLISWVELYERAVSLKIIETANANKDLLQAVKEVLPIWWQAKFQEIVMEKASIETQSLIESFRSTYREIGPNIALPPAAALKGSFSTWQGYQEAKTDAPSDAKKDSKGKLDDTPFEARPCPCGIKFHKPANCYTLNAAMRPDGFTVSKERQRQAEKTLAADLAWKKWVNEAIEKASPKLSNAVTGNMAFSTSLLDLPASSIKDRWILDSGSSVHVCNNRSRFVDLSTCQHSLSTGDGKTSVIGQGTARLHGIDPITRKEKVITLSNVYYAPGFHVNLVSYARLKEKGGHWSEEAGYIEDHNAIPIVSLKLWKSAGLWVFDQPGRAPLRTANAVRSSSSPKQSAASAEVWHRRLGHPQYKTVQQVAKLVEGVTIDARTEDHAICETCHLGRSDRQVSRRPIGRVFGPLGRVHFDLIQLPRAYNKHNWISHFYIEGIRFHWVMTHEYKPECQLAINHFVQLAKNWWKLPIKAFNYDNEKAAGRPAEQSLTSDGIVVYHSPPRHPEMNGYAERAGGVIILRMRMLILEGKLPKELWPEAAMAAVWLLNRTPTYLADQKRWIVPWGEVMKSFAGEQAPPINLANVRLYGSLAYCRIEKQVQSDKMNPRAEIGFLVGYIASNVWKIWFPQANKIRLVRDAIFDESRRYTADFQHFQQVPLPILKEPQELDQTEATRAFEASISTRSMPESELEARPFNDDDQDVNINGNANSNANVRSNEAQHETLDIGQRDRFSAEKPSHKEAAIPLLDSDGSSAKDTVQPIRNQEKPDQTFRGQGVYNTPERERRDEIDIIPGAFPQEVPLPPTPPSEYPESRQGVETLDETRGTQDLARDQAHDTQEVVQEAIEDQQVDSDEEAEMQLLAGLAPRDINGDVDETNIISGSRRRQPKRDDAYSYVAMEPPAYLHAFAAGLYAEKPTRRHRDDLPELPRNWKDVMNHPFQEGFLAAMRKEIESLTRKATFDIIDRPKDRGKQILPLLWVFAYKFDQDGYLIKLKARICVRGDLETISSDEKRAATLAARTARMIFALVAAFDLDLRQRDAVTAFLNSRLDKDVYTRMPEGFGTPGKCWKLRKALYGLRISPRLWQQEAAGVLTKLGLRQVPEDPCVFIGNGIIVFFYVDDILIASHQNVRKLADQLERDLEAHWELTDHGDAEWFLNIRIIRDRRLKKLWLCQDSYISSIAARYHLTDRPPVSTPLSLDELEPYHGKADAQSVHLYQQKVGSAGYATTITRPDAAKANAKLAQFLTNPGPQHQKAADRLISYLYSTRYHAIEYGSQQEDIESVQLASDASYGDHADRKSSAGYICQVYGGPVDWKATKQRTVTTSTTEAELLGLSEAGKHLQWWRRLLRHVGFDPSHVISIECDNERAINLLTSQDASFDTKLRHVDIHHLWLRQEVQKGRISIRWVPTARMVADGLTKLLPRQQHERFVKMLHLVDISHLVDAGKTPGRG